MTSKHQSKITSPMIIIPSTHRMVTTDPEMIQRILKYYPERKFEVMSIAGVLTEPLLGAFSHIWKVHHDTKEVIIQ